MGVFILKRLYHGVVDTGCRTLGQRHGGRGTADRHTVAEGVATRSCTGSAIG